MYVDNIKCNSHIHEVESRYSICCFKHSATNTFPLLDQNRHQIFPFPKSMLPPLDAPAPYLVIATALLQFESSLVVSIALMSGEIWSSCCYVSGTRDRVREIHTAGLSCCSTGMSFFFFILFCISKLLASKDRTSLDERRLCRTGGIYPSHSLFLSLLYVF